MNAPAMLSTAPTAGIPAGLRKRAHDAASGTVDMTPEDWRGLVGGLLKFMKEEAAEPEHAAADMAMDRAFTQRDRVELALDKETLKNRETDKDGRLHIQSTNICKACISPYRGREIPGWHDDTQTHDLGLEPDKIYQMFRPPDELKKAAETSNGVQLMRKHVPVDAKDHQPYDVVGSVGTHASWEPPYVTNGLTIWPEADIEGIKSKRKTELSPGYHYKPVMEPGTFEGESFDGKMTDIVFNHIAIVQEGRQGPDVVVGDSVEHLGVDKENRDMPKPTRLAAYALIGVARAVNPLLAMDAKVNYFPLVHGLTTANIKTRKSAIIAELKAALKGKTIAADASMEHVAAMLDKLEHTKEPKSLDESVSPEQHKAMEAAAHGESNLGIPKDVGAEFSEADRGKSFDAEPMKGFMREKGMSEDDITKCMDMMKGFGKDEDPENALDETDEEKKKREEKEAADKKAKDEKDAEADKAKDMKAMDDRLKGMVTVDAMDKALKSLAAKMTADNQAAAEAREFVRPYVGELPMALDSAEKVLRAAAVIQKIEDADTIHVSALKPLLKYTSRAGAQSGTSPDQLGMDSSAYDSPGAADFDKAFPGAARIGAA